MSCNGRVTKFRAIVLAAAAALLLIPTLSLADPRLDYILNCQGCHGADGGGATGAVPDLRGQMATFLRVPGGREYLVRVPGTSQSELNDARIAGLLNWMLQQFSPEQMPPAFSPYSEAEVARVRRPPLTDVAGVRRQLVQAIEALEHGAPSR